MHRFLYSALLIFSILILACNSSVISTRSNFDFHKIRRVALLNFEDFPQMPVSGELVTSLFEKYLLKTNFELVERREIEKILKEKTFDISGAVDPKTAKEIGQLLGVDALILGNITVFAPEKKSIVLVDIKEVRKEPVIKKETEKIKQDDKWVNIEKDVVKGYTTITKVEQVPQTYTVEAEVGMAVRMVDVETGEILWVASSFEEAMNIQVATEIISNRIVNSVKKIMSVPENKSGI